MMTYTETLDFLYRQLPMYQRSGRSAIKKDLTNIRLLCQELGEPQKNLSFIHIAGTNGKGTVSHIISAILQSMGLKVGLYTSPHYVDFRERIKVNGQLVNEEYVINWVQRFRDSFLDIHPSFFELSVAMAFSYFNDQAVDIVVLETGLGGRLDSTNIVNPIISVITHISLDHQNILGDTIFEISKEKAGIIKPLVPVIIGKYQTECDEVFITKSSQSQSAISWASLNWKIYKQDEDQVILKSDDKVIQLTLPELESPFLLENMMTSLEAMRVLSLLGIVTWNSDNIIDGLENYRVKTRYLGRWQIFSTEPLCIADSAHNEDALEKVVKILLKKNYKNLSLVLGFVKDKDLERILSLFPSNAKFYFVQANIPRALDLDVLRKTAQQLNLKFETFKSVKSGVQSAIHSASAEDLIYIGGSSFVVGEAIEYFDSK